MYSLYFIVASVQIKCRLQQIDTETELFYRVLPADADKMVGEVFSGMRNYRVELTAFSRKIGDSVMVLVSKASTLGQLYDKYDTYSLTAFDCNHKRIVTFVYCSRSFSEFGR